MIRRTSYDAQSVFAWMLHGETYAQAKERLDLAWKAGNHPYQLQVKARHERREERRGTLQ